MNLECFVEAEVKHPPAPPYASAKDALRRRRQKARDTACEWLAEYGDDFPNLHTSPNGGFRSEGRDCSDEVRYKINDFLGGPTNAYDNVCLVFCVLRRLTARGH